MIDFADWEWADNFDGIIDMLNYIENYIILKKMLKLVFWEFSDRGFIPKELSITYM